MELMENWPSALEEKMNAGFLPAAAAANYEVIFSAFTSLNYIRKIDIGSTNF